MSPISIVSTSNSGVVLVILGLSLPSMTYDSGVYRAPTMFAKFDSNLSLYAVQLEWPLSSGSSIIPSSSPSKSARLVWASYTAMSAPQDSSSMLSVSGTEWKHLTAWVKKNRVATSLFITIGLNLMGLVLLAPYVLFTPLR